MNNVYVGNNNNNQTKEHGITFCGALAIAFIVLKLNLLLKTRKKCRAERSNNGERI